MCDHPDCAYKNSANESKPSAASESAPRPATSASKGSVVPENDLAEKLRFYNDPLFSKKEWDVRDWREMYDKMPPDTCLGNYSYLSDYADQILLKEPLRVFVPLCGGSSDLRCLYDRGNTVVGLDAVEKPVQMFFQANNDLEYTVQDIPQGKLYKTKDDRLLLYICELKDVEPKILGKFSAVVDCGSYTAINPFERPKYIDLVTSVLEDDYRYFLEVCHDAPPDAVGLPHSIPLSQVKKDFGPSRKLKFLQTEDISEEWSVETFFQTFILISPKVAKRSGDNDTDSKVQANAKIQKLSP